MEDNAKEPWTNMLKREERTRRFWRYANALGYLDKDLIQPSASEHDEGRQGVDPTSLALVAFATQVGIQLLNDNGDKTLFESFTPSQEYVRWTSEFCGLAKDLGIEVRHMSDDELEELEELEKKCLCAIKHRDDGFEGQEVYVWFGNSKGKFARVKQMNGDFCKVELETALFGESSVVIDGQNLLAYVVL